MILVVLGMPFIAKSQKQKNNLNSACTEYTYCISNEVKHISSVIFLLDSNFCMNLTVIN